MKKLVVALDIDGVVLNFTQSVSKFIEQHYGITSAIAHCHHQYSFEDRFGGDWMQATGFNNIMAEFAKAGGWNHIEAMHHTSQVRTLLTSPLFDVHVVTLIDPVHQLARQRNLETILGITIPLERLHCVKPAGTKKPAIDRLQPDFFVEDHYAHLVECAGDHVSIWIDNVSFDNKTAPDSNTPHILGVRHFDEAFDVMHAIALKRQKAWDGDLLALFPSLAPEAPMDRFFL